MGFVPPKNQVWLWDRHIQQTTALLASSCHIVCTFQCVTARNLQRLLPVLPTLHGQNPRTSRVVWLPWSIVAEWLVNTQTFLWRPRLTTCPISKTCTLQDSMILIDSSYFILDFNLHVFNCFYMFEKYFSRQSKQQLPRTGMCSKFLSEALLWRTISLPIRLTFHCRLVGWTPVTADAPPAGFQAPVKDNGGDGEGKLNPFPWWTIAITQVFVMLSTYLFKEMEEGHAWKSVVVHMHKFSCRQRSANAWGTVSVAVKWCYWIHFIKQEATRCHRYSPTSFIVSDLVRNHNFYEFLPISINFYTWISHGSYIS